MTGTNALRLEGLTVGYGGRAVVRDLSLELPAGAFGAVLGANGAGKTTTLRGIMGRAEILSGAVEVAGRRIDRLTTAMRVRAGVALVPEGRRVFGSLTVAENLQCGALGADKWPGRRAVLDEIMEEFPGLARRRDQAAGNLSGGEQQMLAIGRALMARPTVLLVDEASLGLAPIVVAQLFARLARLHETGTTVLAVEQNASVLDHVDHVYVLDQGRLRLGGPVADIGERVRSEIADAYLGDEKKGEQTNV